jgi:hypothetical protein
MCGLSIGQALNDISPRSAANAHIQFRRQDVESYGIERPSVPIDTFRLLAGGAFSSCPDHPSLSRGVGLVDSTAHAALDLACMIMI